MDIIAANIKNILDILSDGIFISDSSGQTLFVNKMYEQLTGLQQKDLCGKNVRELVTDGCFDAIVNPEVVNTGKPITHVQKLANNKRVVLTGFPVFSPDKTLCLVVTFVRDITVLTQLQEDMTAQKKLIDKFHDRLAFIAKEQSKESSPVFKSPEMQKVIDLVTRFAKSEATILILGETGVGKDVIARLAHELSPRQGKMFFKVDCGGIAENLTESELFGYVAGAFTGAGPKGKSGYFEMAEGGTIFLDEVGELSLSMQTKLLRVLQDGEIMRVGSSTARKVNVRIIAATNRDLATRVTEGLFRRDLFYRLSVANVHIPPLRTRQADITPLIQYFLDGFNIKYRKNMYFTPECLEQLCLYDWPGNVRELQNFIHSLVITKDQEALTLQDLPGSMLKVSAQIFLGCDDPKYDRPLKAIMADLEKEIIKKALLRHGSVQKVAEIFQINRSTLFRKLQD